MIYATFYFLGMCSCKGVTLLALRFKDFISFFLIEFRFPRCSVERRGFNDWLLYYVIRDSLPCICLSPTFLYSVIPLFPKLYYLFHSPSIGLPAYSWVVMYVCDLDSAEKYLSLIEISNVIITCT